LSHPGVAFLDRDGTINEKAPEGDYIKSPDELRILPGAAAAIRRLNEAGISVIVVSNQRGIALGRMTEADLRAVHDRVAHDLDSSAGARLDAFFHCPHDVGECNCRKPDIGMFHRARERFPWIDFSRSVMIGDSPSDVEAGRRMGMGTIQIGVDAPDLAAAVDQLLAAATIRVLHVLPHRGGGGERYIDLLERLPDFSHERFYLSAGRTPASAMGSIPLRWPRLARRVRAVDLVHCHGETTSAIALPLLSLRPAVVTTHGLHLLRRASGVGGFTIRSATRWVGRRCRVVICTSSSERAELAALLRPSDRHRLRVIRNGVEPPSPIPAPERAALRESLGVGPDTVLGLFVGQLEPRKAPLVAAHAAVEARGRGAGFVLAVAGDGPQAAELEALAGESVIPLGHRSDVERLMDAADLFVQSSEREGASYALLEAMARGLPVIASTGSGNPEIVDDAGLQFAVGDSTGLAGALVRLTVDPELRASLGARAATQVAERFTLRRFLDETETVYREALAGVREPGRAAAGARA
jgi:D-glycero-D-manno-heptose 1,7-bisphosphate phosphatase